MKTKFLLFLLVITAVALVAVSCAPAPTPTPVPTAVPTKAPPTSAPATAAPTAVPPTSAPTTAAATVAATTAPTSAATTAATAASGALPPTKATPALPSGTPKSADDMLEVTPQQLKAMMDGGADIVIVDAQAAEAYALGHIPGAVNVPWDMKIKAPSGLSQSKLLVVYCGCSPDAKPAQTDAGEVAMQLYTTYGYRKLATLKGGWDTWQQMGLPTAKGK